MISWLLKATLPGGVPLVEALGVGLKGGLDPSLQTSTVLSIEDTGNPLAPRVQVEPRSTGGLYSRQEVAQLGLRQAKLMPQAAGSLLRSSPVLAYSLLKPINDLAATVVTPFRRAGLPRVTGLEGLPTLGEMLADARAGALIAANFMPPPPWRPDGSLGGIAVGAAAASIWGLIGDMGPDFWGLVSGRPEAAGVPTAGPDDTPVISGSWATGVDALTRIQNSQFPNSSSTWTNFNLLSVGITGGHSLQVSPLTGVATTLRNELVWSCTIFGNPRTNSARTWPGYSWILEPVAAGPSIPAESFFGGANGPASVPYPWPPVLPDAPSPLLLPPAPVPPYALPDAPTELETDRPIVPVSPTTVRTVGGQTIQTTRLPGYWPELLNPEGTRSPLPAETPALTPVTPFGPVALPAFPSADPARPTQQTNTAAQVVPLAPQRPPTTEVGSIVPWPGATPIPAVGPAPRPDLEGIAQEVGKIERKLEIMMNPEAPGNLVDRFGDLSNLLEPLVEAIIALNSGTTYSLDSPCEVDANGDKLPPVLVEAPGALTSFGAMFNRIDALAELLQVHKNLKQPNCKPKQPTGEFVTVNFEQID